jgi:hypothetical protein
MRIPACDLLYEPALRFDVELGAEPADNGSEFCGRPEQHPCEPWRAVDGIECWTTKPPARGPTASPIG